VARAILSWEAGAVSEPCLGMGAASESGAGSARPVASPSMGAISGLAVGWRRRARWDLSREEARQVGLVGKRHDKWDFRGKRARQVDLSGKRHDKWTCRGKRARQVGLVVANSTTSGDGERVVVRAGDCLSGAGTRRELSRKRRDGGSSSPGRVWSDLSWA